MYQCYVLISSLLSSFVRLCLNIKRNFLVCQMTKRDMHLRSPMSWRLWTIFFLSDFKCMEALGMESGEIHSDQITASSQYSTNWSAERSRLNYPENGWTPGEDSYREWIQVCSIRPGTFRAEEAFGHLERLLKKVPCQTSSYGARRTMAPSVIAL